MRIGTYNIRGLGGKAKKKDIQLLVRLNKLDVLCVQETKTVKIDRSTCAMLWDVDDFAWEYNPAQGAAGGLITVWRTTMFQMEVCFRGSGYLSVSGWRGINRQDVTFINVYAPCEGIQRRQLW